MKLKPFITIDSKCKYTNDIFTNISSILFNGGGRLLAWVLILLILINESQGGHDFLLEEVPLRDRVVEFGLWEVDQHSSDLRRPLVTYKLLDVLVDRVTDDVLFLGLLCGLEILRHEHCLHLFEIGPGVHHVDVLGI